MTHRVREITFSLEIKEDEVPEVGAPVAILDPDTEEKVSGIVQEVARLNWGEYWKIVIHTTEGLEEYAEEDAAAS